MWIPSRAVVAAFSVLSFSSLAYAADVAAVPAPSFKVGDSWVLQETTQKGAAFSQAREQLSVERLNSDSMVVAVKVPDAPTPPRLQVVGLDWSHKLTVNDEEKTTNRPLSFPAKVGDSWTQDWIDPRRLGNQVSAHNHQTYKVIGWEDVTVPAGAFHALKIEAKGWGDVDLVIPSVAQSRAVGEPGAAAATSRVQKGGRAKAHVTTYALIYYAPEVKYPIKTVDEQYNDSEVMIERQTEEMVSFKAAG